MQTRSSRELERRLNIDAQKNIYTLFTQLEISLKEANIPCANIIIKKIYDKSSSITQGKDVEDIGLVYTPPSMFSSYEMYLNEQLIYFENERDTVTQQQLSKIAHKLKLSIVTSSYIHHAKYGNDLVIEYKTMNKIINFVNRVFGRNYHLFYKTAVPETLSTSIAEIIFNTIKPLNTRFTIYRWFNIIDYDLHLEYDSSTHKSKLVEDNILHQITNRVRNNTDYVLAMPPFLTSFIDIPGVNIPTAEIVKD